MSHLCYINNTHMLQYKLEIVEWLIRTLAGIIFLFQGYDKLFKVKIQGVVDTFLTDAEEHHFHRPTLTLMAYFTSIVEFFGGITLLLGLFVDYTLILLGIDLVLAAVAFSIVQPVWDMRHVFPRFMLVIALMLLPEEWCKFSLDYLINK